MIRLATANDALPLIDLSKLCYDEMQFDDFGYAFEYTTGFHNYLTNATNPKVVIAVCEEQGELIGVQVALIQHKTMYFNNHAVAQEIVFHAHPKLSPRKKFEVLDGLLTFTEKELVDRGCFDFYPGSDVRFPGVAKLLKKRGYKPMALHHHKDLKGGTT